MSLDIVCFRLLPFANDTSFPCVTRKLCSKIDKPITNCTILSANKNSMKEISILKRPLSLLSQLVPLLALCLLQSCPTSLLSPLFPAPSALKASSGTIHLLLTTLRKADGESDPACADDDVDGIGAVAAAAAFARIDDDNSAVRSRSHLFFHTVRARNERDKAGRGCRSHARKKCEGGNGARKSVTTCSKGAIGADKVKVVEMMGSVSAIVISLQLCDGLKIRGGGKKVARKRIKDHESKFVVVSRMCND